MMLVFLLPIGLMPLYDYICKKKKTIVFLCATSIFLLLTLRADSYGMDASSYSGAYSVISTYSFSELIGKLHFLDVADLPYPYSLESGFVVTMWLVSRFGLSYHGYLVAFAAFGMFSLGTWIYKYSEKPGLSFMMFSCLTMLNYSFGVLRQTLAMFVLLWAVNEIKEQKLFKFLLILAVAFLIHRSSIVFVALYFVYNLKVKRDTLLVYLFTCGVFMLVSPFVYNSVITKILVALNKTRYIGGEATMNNQLILMILINIVLVLLIRYSEYDKWLNKLSLYAVLLALPIEIMSMYHEVLGRCIYILWIYICLIIPNVISTYRDKRIGFIIKVILPILLLVFEAYTLHDTILLPYKFFWE